MSLLKELVNTINLVEAKRSKRAPVVNNLAAKHSQNKAGAGRHEDKTGTKAKRERQKRQWKKDISREM